MGSVSEEDRGPRRRRDEDQSETLRIDDRESHRGRDDRKDRRRHRSREREHRRRSKSPDFRSKRSRSRERERRRDRDRIDRHGPDDAEENNPTGRDRGGKRSHRDKDSERDGREHRRRSSRDGRDRGHRDRRSGPDNDLGRTIGDEQRVVKHRGPLPSQGDSFAISTGEMPEKPVEKPNFGNSGVLAAASNAVTQADGSTVTLKYHEPPEARKPSPRDVWKLYLFKGPDLLDDIPLSSRSCWLIGRDSAVVDLPAEHPSISKQHAVIQFRYTEKRNEFGDKIGRVKPYLIDLESANGTLLNNDKVPESRYLELRHKDVIQFGSSTREYVVILAPKD